MNEKLIFCGDLVCPFDCKVDYKQVKPLFKDAIGIANLEGAILKDKEQVNHFKWKDKYSLYSSPEVLDILDNLNIKYISLCNNHILDYEQPIEVTNRMLIQHGVNQWGLKNHDVLQLKLNEKNVYIITFATFANEHSLNLFNPHKVLKDIESLRQKEPDCLIVVYPHWGVEKFYYPEPADRVLAHACVDAGANLIVGHHPHIIQPIEFYKGTFIIYSIGNFILPQTYYGEKKLVYKQKEVQQELVVEWDGSDVKFHPLYFDKERNILLPDSTYNTNKLLTLFKDEIGYGHYLRIYINHASKLDIFLRTRYMANLTNEYISYISRKALRYVRRLFILLKLHDPYKNVSQINDKGGGKNKLLNIRRSDNESLASKVLFLGIAWRKPHGGVAAV
ncbi:MAG: CapA family protein, partial [Prevotella sp.]|nr:CapA family protein [Prevotella sp.]